MRVIASAVALLLSVGHITAQMCNPSNGEVTSHYTRVANNIPGNDVVVDATTSVKWADLLVPAPTAISVLSSLLLVTTARDVSLVGAGPTNGWLHVQFPNSLRASTMQVANEAYYALSGAHHNMEFIQAKTDLVPSYFQHIAQIVEKGTVTERRVHLPASVARLRSIAVQCSERAVATAEAFDTVNRLIDELLTACVSKQGVSKAELEQITVNLRVVVEAQDRHKVRLEKIEEQAAVAEKNVAATMKEYQEAIKDRPGLGDLIAGAFVDTFTNSINSIFGNSKSSADESTNVAPSDPAVKGDTVKTDLFKIDINALFMNSVQPKHLVMMLQSNKSEDAQNGARELKAKLDIMHTSLSSDGVPEIIVNSEKELFDQACNMLDKIISSADQANSNQNLTDLMHSADSWIVDVGVLQQQLNKQSPMSPQSPTKAKLNSADNSINGQQMSGYRTSVENQRHLMDLAQEEIDKQHIRLDKAVEQSANLLANVTRLNMEEASVKEIIEVLRAAIVQLGTLSNAWKKLVYFFESISTQIEGKHFETIDYFTEQIQGSIASADEKGRFDASTDLLYRAAFKASAENWRVNRIAATYVKVSSEHFMPPLMNISSLLTIDVGADGGRQQLQQTSGVVLSRMKKTLGEIKSLIDKEEVENNIKRVAHMKKLDADLQSLCPGDDGREQQEIAAKIVKQANEKPKLDLQFGGGW